MHSKSLQVFSANALAARKLSVNAVSDSFAARSEKEFHPRGKTLEALNTGGGSGRVLDV